MPKKDTNESVKYLDIVFLGEISMSIFEETKNKLHKNVTDIGFKLKGRTYYRLMDRYVQGFKIYTYNLSFSIRFFQQPLCFDIDKKYEGDDIHKFWSGIGPFSIVGIYTGDDSYSPNPFGIKVTPENYVNEASEILIRSFNEYLLPWFERSDTIEKAYEENCLMFHHDGKYPAGRYPWLLQMGKWLEAAEFINERIKELKLYESMPDYIGGSLTSNLEELHNAIIKNDNSFVLDYIHTQERQTIKSLGFTRVFNKFNNKSIKS